MMRSIIIIKDKKGFFRTLEVLIAIVLTFLFVSHFIPKFTPTEMPSRPELNIVSRLLDSDDFRDCALIGDTSCVRSHINLIIPPGYGFDTSISSDINYEMQGLPVRNVYIESAFISGNITVYNPVVVKVYYWRK